MDLNTNGHTITVNSAAEFAGNITSGAGGGFTKAGVGTLTLSGTNNTYAGATVVNAGAVLYDGTGAFTNGIAAVNRDVTVNTSGTLGFTANFGAGNIPTALLVFYDGSIFHSGDIQWASSADYRAGLGRLTVNAFFKSRKLQQETMFAEQA